jgi:hypothetical protein
MWQERIPVSGLMKSVVHLNGAYRKLPYMDLFVSSSPDNLAQNPESMMESKANMCRVDTPCVTECLLVPVSPTQSVICVVGAFAYVHSPLPPPTSSPLLSFYVRGEYHQEDDQEEEHRPETIPGLAMFPDLLLSPCHLLGVLLIEPGPKCVEFCFNGSKNVQFRRCDGLHNFCHTIWRLISGHAGSIGRSIGRIYVGRVRMSREIVGSSSSLLLTQRSPCFFRKVSIGRRAICCRLLSRRRIDCSNRRRFVCYTCGGRSSSSSSLPLAQRPPCFFRKSSTAREVICCRLLSRRRTRWNNR